jgi:hypothetical protein
MEDWVLTRYRLEGERAARLLLLVCIAVVRLPIAGCREEMSGISPTDTAKAVVAALVNKDESALRTLLAENSKPLLQVRSDMRERGVFYLVSPDTVGSADSCRVVLTKEDKNSAQVNLVPGSQSMKAFDKPLFPPSLKKDGIPLVLVKESGEWKLDLWATSDLLIDATLKANGGVLPVPVPPWWPGFLGMPGPPGE